MNDERQENDMFQNRNKSQEKQKKPRVLSIGTRRPVVIALWALLICAFAFAVYKDFTAVDTHTVHETTVVQEEVTDTNAIESFVTTVCGFNRAAHGKSEILSHGRAADPERGHGAQ